MKLKLSHLIVAGTVCVAASAFIIVKPAPPTKFIDPVNMDMSVKPGDDFFMYANEGG